jgi:hypothetical protein
MKRYRVEHPEVQERFKKNNPNYWIEYSKEYYIKNRDREQEKNKRRINIKGQNVVYVESNPRTGQCSICLRKVGEGIKQTQIHHINYHDDPLKDTIEVCVSCHNKQRK